MADHLPIAHNISYVLAKAITFRNEPDPNGCAGFGREAPVAMRGNEEIAFEPSNAWFRGRTSFTKDSRAKEHLRSLAPLSVPVHCNRLLDRPFADAAPKSPEDEYTPARHSR